MLRDRIMDDTGHLLEFGDEQLQLWVLKASHASGVHELDCLKIEGPSKVVKAIHNRHRNLNS
jgi:hypothetical protein